MNTVVLQYLLAKAEIRTLHLNLTEMTFFSVTAIADVINPSVRK